MGGGGWEGLDDEAHSVALQEELAGERRRHHCHYKRMCKPCPCYSGAGLVHVVWWVTMLICREGLGGRMGVRCASRMHVRVYTCSVQRDMVRTVLGKGGGESRSRCGRTMGR